MKHTMLLTELIAQLQAVADQKPGILCAINDQEWGLYTPQLQMERVYTDEPYDVLSYVSQESYGHALAGLTRVYDCENDWLEMEEETKQYYVSLENYKDEIKKIKDDDQKTVDIYNRATEILTFTVNAHGIENTN